MTVSATTATTAPSSTSTTALSSLAGNFTDFLQLLMTQLKNQDPTAPMDTNQFTSQLVQFTSVEQQINTNSSLTTLIQTQQGGNLLQSAALVGQQVTVSGDQLSLQGGQASLQFTTTGSQPVSIGIYSATGAKLQDASVTSTPGTNSWTWNGRDASGATLPDGGYKAVVQAADGTAIPFNPVGTVTGVQRNGTAMKVALGSVSVDLNDVQSVAPK